MCWLNFTKSREWSRNWGSNLGHLGRNKRNLGKWGWGRRNWEDNLGHLGRNKRNLTNLASGSRRRALNGVFIDMYNHERRRSVSKVKAWNKVAVGGSHATVGLGVLSAGGCNGSRLLLTCLIGGTGHKRATSWHATVALRF